MKALLAVILLIAVAFTCAEETEAIEPDGPVAINFALDSLACVDGKVVISLDMLYRTPATRLVVQMSAKRSMQSFDGTIALRDIEEAIRAINAMRAASQHEMFTASRSLSSITIRASLTQHGPAIELVDTSDSENFMRLDSISMDDANAATLCDVLRDAKALAHQIDDRVPRIGTLIDKHDAIAGDPIDHDLITGIRVIAPCGSVATEDGSLDCIPGLVTWEGERLRVVVLAANGPLLPSSITVVDDGIDALINMLEGTREPGKIALPDNDAVTISKTASTFTMTPSGIVAEPITLSKRNAGRLSELLKKGRGHCVWLEEATASIFATPPPQ